MTCKIRLPKGVVLEADTILSISHSYESEATAHPVEDGATISDHVLQRPRKATIEVLFTAHPVRPGLFPDGPTRPQRAFGALANVMERRDVVGVDADGEVYDPAVLTKLTEPRTFDDGDARRFRLEVQELRTVTADTAPSIQAPRLRSKGRPKRKTQSATVADLKLAALGRAAQGDFVGAFVLGVAGVAR